MKEYCGVVLTLTHWRPYIFGKHFTVITNHQALTHLYYIRDTSNVLTFGLVRCKTSFLPLNTSRES